MYVFYGEQNNLCVAAFDWKHAVQWNRQICYWNSSHVNLQTCRLQYMRIQLTQFNYRPVSLNKSCRKRLVASVTACWINGNFTTAAFHVTSSQNVTFLSNSPWSVRPVNSGKGSDWPQRSSCLYTIKKKKKNPLAYLNSKDVLELSMGWLLGGNSHLSKTETPSWWAWPGFCVQFHLCRFETVMAQMVV